MPASRGLYLARGKLGLGCSANGPPRMSSTLTATHLGIQDNRRKDFE
jgi:hypothetical protein